MPSFSVVLTVCEAEYCKERSIVDCRCADGFTGDNCELKCTSCGDASALFCMFGNCESVELYDNGNTDVMCVCQNDNDQLYAGTACNMPATLFCT